MLTNEKGLTLVEAMSAVVILSFVVLMFTSISGYSLLSISKSDKTTEALRVAETYLNQARSALKTTNTLPAPAASSIYSVTIQGTDLTATPVAYSPAGTGAHQVSLQSFYLDGSSPKVLTVIVTWE